jgi:hypothetical protein
MFAKEYEATRAGEAGRPFLGSTFSEMQAYESGKASVAGQIAGPAGGTLLLLGYSPEAPPASGRLPAVAHSVPFSPCGHTSQTHNLSAV